MTVLLIAGALDGGAIPAPAAPVLPPLTGAALLDDWGNRMATLGTSVGENSLRTQIRTTIAQLAMFDAVNAVLDGPYEPFASKPAAAPGAARTAAPARPRRQRARRVDGRIPIVRSRWPLDRWRAPRRARRMLH